jgi:hypothetical protein
MSLQQVAALEGLGRGLMDSFDRSPAARMEDSIVSEGGNRKIADVLNTLDTASTASSRSFDTAQGAYNRQVRGLGVNVDADQQRAAQRRIGLSRALTSVDSRNRAVGELRNRTDIARSSASSLRDIVEGQLINARGQAAQMEAGREIDYQQARAKYKADKAQTLGTIASMAAMFIPGVGPLVAPAIGGAVAKAAY